jgi:enoyl-CoA hydratase/carnithine racemase
MPSDENPNTPVEALRENRVTRVRLNLPEERNRLSPAMVRALLQEVRQAEADPGAGCLLLEQRGSVFCSGFDHGSISQPGVVESLQTLFRLQRELRKPLVAAVSGACAGAGIALLLQCHYVLAAQGTRFSVNDIHSAIWPALYYPCLLRACGPRRACELALTGRVFSAADALAWGLVQELVPPYELEDRALQMADGLASLSPAAVSSGLAFAAEAAAGEHSPRPAEWFREAAGTPDFFEALAAAREQRKPRWPSLSAAQQKRRGPEPAPGE